MTDSASFTLEQINNIHDRLGSAETFLQYVEGLKDISVEQCDSYVVDGHSEYFGANEHTVKSLTVHESLSIANNSNKEGLLKALTLHEQQQTSYIEMSRSLAESGIQKWTIDTSNMTMAYYAKDGDAMLVEAIE